MRLRALRVHNVRHFGGRGVALEGIADGLNSFAEPNETGKSTLFDALRALLFFKETSRHRDIESLRPYDGGYPRIAADVETDAGLYRVEKRFLGGTLATVSDVRSGAEIARAGAAQDWIDRLVGSGDAQAGPTGLLWVQQGNSADVNAGRGARTAAMQSIVATELDTMTGGERMRRVRDRVAEELGPYLTAGGNVRGGGPLGQARQEVEELAAEEAALARQFARLEGDLETRRQLRRDLSSEEGTAEEAARRTAALAGARQDLAEAERAAAGLPAAEAAVRTSELEAVAAAEALASFEAARDEAVKAMRASRESAERLPGLERALSEAVAAEIDAKRAADEASLGLRAARGTAVRARRGARRADLLTQRTSLVKARGQAVEAQTAAHAALAAANRIGVDDEALILLQELATDRDRAIAAVAAASTRLSMRYAGSDAARITVDGASLEDGVSVQLSGPARLALPGLGELEVVPGGSGGMRAREDERREAEAGLADALSGVGVSTLEEARVVAEERRAWLAEGDRQGAIARAHAPEGIETLEREIARIGAEIDAIPEEGTPTPEEAEAALEAAEAADSGAREQLVGASAVRAAAERTLSIEETRSEGLKKALDAALVRSGPEASWPERQIALSGGEAAARAALAGAREALEMLSDARPALELARAAVRRLEEAEANRARRIAQLRERLAELDGLLRAATAEGIAEKLTEVQGRLEASRSRLDAINVHFRALIRLRDTLAAAHGRMHAAWFEPLNAELRPLLARVLGGEALDFDADSYAPTRLTRRGRDEDLAVLSGGTQEQIAILTRLAFARLLARRGNAPPVILDDALVFSDDDRIVEMFNVLQAHAADLQIIVFSCRQRAFRDLGGNRLILTEWSPEN